MNDSFETHDQRLEEANQANRDVYPQTKSEYPIVDPSQILEWPMTVAKATKEEIVLRDHGGAEVKITVYYGELKYERIW